MPTYTWNPPPSGSDGLWPTATNWAIGTVSAGSAPGPGDTAIIDNAAVNGPGNAAVIDLNSGTLVGAIQAGIGDGTIAATGVSRIGSGGSSASIATGTLIIGTATTDLAGARLIFSATSTASVTATIASEIDLGVGQIGNGGGGVNPNPATNIEVLEVETRSVPADYLEVDGSQISVDAGGSVYVGRANQSAVDLIVSDGGVMDVGDSTTWLGYGTKSLGLLEVDSGGTFVGEGTTVLGYGTGALGELVMGDPRLSGHPAGFFIQNGGELDLGASGTGVVGGLNPTTLVLSNGASLGLGTKTGGVGIVSAGVPLQVASDIDIGIAVGASGQIGSSTGGNLLTVGGDVNVGFAGRGSLFNASGTICTGLSSSVLDIGLLQPATGVVTLGGLFNSSQT